MKTRWIFWLLVIAFVWLLVSRFTEVQKLIQTLSQGQLIWILAAAILQVFYYIAYTGIYQSAFDTVDVQSQLRHLLPVTFASIFINVAAPSSGVSGAALFIDDAKRRGESGARAAVGTVLMLAADFAAFLGILVTGIFFLFSYHDLKSYEILGATVLLVLFSGLVTLLLLGFWKPEWLHRLLAWIRRIINSLGKLLKRPEVLSIEWIETTTSEFAEAGIAIATHPDRLWRTILVALVANLVSLASLFCLFLAFHQRVSLGVLVAGYSMGILFWIVSITPQGIGVVEGVMTLVFTSLGVPPETAAIVSLSFRGLTFWLPLAIGFLLLQQVKTFNARKASSPGSSGVHLISILTGLTGVINVLSAVTPSLMDRLRILERYSPLSVSNAGHLASAIAGFALLMLSVNLWRRKRMAWLLTEIVLVFSFFNHLFKGLDYEEAILSLALAAWLLYLHPHFHARSDPPSVRQGIFTLAGALVFTLFYGIIGFYFLDRHFKVNFGFSAALRQTIMMFTQFSDPGLEPVTRFGRYFADSIYAVSAITIAYSLWMLVRPVLVRSRPHPAEHQRAQEIVETWGHSSLARFTLLNDKLYFFSQGNTLFAYAVRHRIAVVLGDPIGPPQDLQPALSEFAAFCARNDWMPAYYQVLPDNLDVYKSSDYDVLCIGHEGIVDLCNFTIAGGENKSIRTTFNRLTKLGFTAEFVDPPHAQNLLSELRDISNEWLTHMHGSEKQFSLGWFDYDYLNTCPLLVVRNPQARADAFANIIPEYNRNEACIDLMRHRASTENGLMDFLFISMLQWARDKGYQTFNLGLSSLSGIGENPKDPAIERALHYIYEHVDQFYNFKGLHEFKNKYHPTWSPRYMIYPGLASLPAVTIAMILADSGDDWLLGFLRKP